MTLVVSITGPRTIWMLTDRRLTNQRVVLRENAIKLASVTATDGFGLLGYCGLGMTAAGSQPSTWMSTVLRGHRNLTFEESLSVLVTAAKEELPRHLKQLSGNGPKSHLILASAFVNSQPRLYTIGVGVSAGRKEFQYTRRVLGTSPPMCELPRRIVVSGSGGSYLDSNRYWARPLLRLANACERDRIAPEDVADRLAEINLQVHKQTKDGTVGDRCVVVWRYQNEGGSYRAYIATDPDETFPGPPSVHRGHDMSAMARFFVSHFGPMLAGNAPIEFDKEAIDAGLAALPDKPDKTLR